MSKPCIHTILLIDDNPLQRELLSKMLAKDGYSVIAAEEVMEAMLEIATKKIDLIITDIEMPTVSGFQLLKFLKRKHINIPVAFLSSHSGTGVQLMGEDLGAAAFFSKPVDSVEMLKKLRTILIAPKVIH